MPEPPIPRSIDRRKFMNGGWTDRDDERSSDTVEIASILVRARPEHLDEAARAIEALPGAQIYSRDPKGKLVAPTLPVSVASITTTSFPFGSRL